MSALSIFQQLQQAYLLLDAENHPLQVNPAAQQLLGEKLDTLADSELWHSIQTLLPECHDGAILNFYHNSQTFQLSVSVVEENNQVLKALAIQHAMASREELHNLYSLLDNLGAYVYCKDRHYRYNFINKEVCTLFNHPAEQIIHQEDEQFFDQQTALHLRQNDQRVIDHGEVLEKEECNFVPHLEEYRHYLTVKKPIYNAQGSISGLLGISTDITELKQTQQQLHNSEQQLTSILDNIDACIFIKDRDCRFLYINKKTEALAGRSCEDVIGLSNLELFGPEASAQFERTDRQVFLQEQRLSCIETMQSEDRIHYYWTVKVPMKNDLGQVDRYIGISIDITEQKELEYQLRASNQMLQDKITEISLLKDELQIQASHDELTGLYNRRFLHEHADLVFPEMPRSPSSLLIIDVDHFKKVNDTLGHSKGDEILQCLAQVMRQSCRANDLICRYGGEEFIILLPGAEPDSALKKAELIRTSFQKTVTALLPDDMTGSLSVGIAGTPMHGKGFRNICQAADHALYQAKAAGRNRAFLATIQD